MKSWIHYEFILGEEDRTFFGPQNCYLNLHAYIYILRFLASNEIKKNTCAEMGSGDVVFCAKGGRAL